MKTWEEIKAKEEKERRDLIQGRARAEHHFANGTPCHIHFSRKYWEGGYKCSSWVGWGYTGKIYYQCFYQNMGTMLAQVYKKDFMEGMKACLAKQDWTTITVSEPNWQMMEAEDRIQEGTINGFRKDSGE